MSLLFHLLALFFLRGFIDSEVGGGSVALQTILAVDLAPIHGPRRSEKEEGVSIEWGRVTPTTTIEAPAKPAAVSAGGLPSTLPSKRDYVPSRELGQRATPILPIIVPFPDAVSEKRSGVVILQLDLSESGEVDTVRIVESDLPDAFGVAAQQAFQVAKFHPGIKDGHAVPVRMKIEVRFSEGQ